MRCTVFIIFLIGYLSYAQNSAESLCKKKLAELQKTEVGTWKMLNDTTLIWVHNDTFTTVNKTSPIRGMAFADSMTITLTFQENWSQKILEETSKLNTSLIDPLSLKFIAAMDSINWEGVKLNENMFLANEVLYLPLLRSITKFTDEDMENYRKIQRLPDFIVDGIGIFLDTKPNYGCQYIKEIENDNLLFEQLQFVSKTLGSEKTKIGIKQYEL